MYIINCVTLGYKSDRHSQTYGPVHTNAALFLRLGPPSTLIRRHENGAFGKHSSN